jgi:phosphohistidine phosphatase
MELILWRHAEAEEGSPDNERKLTGKGLQQARMMAEWLRPRLPQGTRVLVSPTTRTQQTAAALALDFETIREIGPGAPAEAVLRASGWPDANGATILVGHQPTLGEVCAFLMSGKSRGWIVQKGAIWWFSVKSKGGGVPPLLLQAVVSPGILDRQNNALVSH